VKLADGASGYELCHELRDRFEGIRVVFISGVRTEPFDRVGGLLMGADDYLVKPFDPDELVARVRKLVRRGAESQTDDDLAAALTAREREVLELLAAGLPQAAIAKTLVLSPKTVGTHIQNVLAKLDVHSRAEAVAVAYRSGVVGSVSAHVFALGDD
jgi:DNA-binding NarL/FixJ family response regulator